MPRVVRGEPSPGSLLVLLGYLALAVILPISARPVLCPFRMATGRNCPLCGLTRSTHELVRGRVRAARDHNALTPLLWLAGVAWAAGFKLDTHSAEAAQASPVRVTRGITAEWTTPGGLGRASHE